MKKLLIVALLGLSGLVNAQTLGAISGSISESAAASVSSAYTGASTSGNANTQNINFNSPPAPTTVEIRSVPSIVAPIIGVTANCMSGASIGASAMGWGFSGGTSIEDTNCTRRENARLLHNLGKSDIALKLLCNDKEIAVVMDSCAKPAEAK